MKKNGKTRKHLNNFIRWIMLIFCGTILGLNIYYANANGIVGNQLPMPFGVGAAVILSGSMEPILSIDDLIVVTESETYQENDIVVVQDGRVLVVHRIIKMDGDTIVTKGDANSAEDDPLNISAVKGKVLFWIPSAGRVVSFLKTPIGTFLVLFLAFILTEIPRRNERKRDDDERQKIIDEIKRLKEE